jgi:hypothetical protein
MLDGSGTFSGEAIRPAMIIVVAQIVLPVEADFAFVDVEKAVIGDGDAMGVSRDVGQDLFGAAKGGLA